MRKDVILAAALLIGGAAFAQQPAKTKTAAPEAVRLKALTTRLQNEATTARAREKALTERLAVLAQPGSRWSGSYSLFTPMAFKKIDLSLKDTPVREALKQAVQKGTSNADVVVDNDVPDGARVNVDVKQTNLAEVLTTITNQVGAGWRVEQKDGKTSVRVGKTVRTSGLPFALSVSPNGSTFLRSNGSYTVPFSTYRMDVTERRSTFTCPHCKGQATVIRTAAQPSCPDCGRTFQSSWQFCPVDGTKRPADPNAWKHCPLCGKAVDLEKATKAAAKATKAK